MSWLNETQLQQAKDFIFRNGRLLERKLFEHFFERAVAPGCLRALLAYQNPDGGFGNGIEPDLLCPESTLIGTESALYVLDLLGIYDPEIVAGVIRWMTDHQNEQGFIPHPPASLVQYPHQPWWRNPDDARILVLTGLLKKWGVRDDPLYGAVRRYYETAQFPEQLSFYSYPYFVYLKFCGETGEDRDRLAWMQAQLPAFMAEHRDHFPLFSRYWFYALDDCDPGLVTQEAQYFVGALQAEGAVPNPYPDLPWWRPIFTLDGLILLKKRGLLERL